MRAARAMLTGGALALPVSVMNASRPTVFLAIPNYVYSSDFLRTEFIRALARRARVVVLMPIPSEGYPRIPGVSYEPWSLQFPGFWRFWGKTVRVPLIRMFDHDPLIQRNYRLSFGHWKRRMLRRAAFLFPKHVWNPDSISRLEAFFAPRSKRFEDLVRKYRPALVVTATPGFTEVDAEQIILARKAGLPSAAIDFSWDNLTSNAKHLRKPDYLMCWTERMRRQAVSIHAFDPGRVFVSGIMRFDHYFKTVPGERDRKTFLEAKGLDPAEKTILVTAVTRGNYRDEPKIVSDLIRMRGAGVFPGRPNIFVRLHPKEDNYGDYEMFGSVPGVHVERAGTPMEKNLGSRIEMNESDLVNLKDTLRHADVVVNYASTITLEAFAFSKPVVNIGFPPEFLNAYSFTHYKPVAETGAVKIARSIGELGEEIRRALHDPKQGQESRLKAAEEFIGPADGNAFLRAANVVGNIASGNVPEAEPAHARTIFVSLFQGVEAKNLLRTGVARRLLQGGGVRLVGFVRTEERKRYYEETADLPMLAFEVHEYRWAGMLDRLLAKLKFALLRTATTDLRRKMARAAGGGYAQYWLGFLANRMLARPLVRKAVRLLDEHFVRDRQYAAYFDRWRPGAVLLAHLFDEEEIGILREAKKRNIPVIGFINSWDKLTARSTLRLLPDKMLVFNELLKEEAVRHGDVPEARIQAVGIPQYDVYANHVPVPREDFLKQIGMDPNSRFFLYAPMGETFSRSDWDVIDLLREWKEQGVFGAGVDFLVRFQPNDAADQNELARRPWLKFERPGRRFERARGVDWDMTEDEMKHLADTLAHMSLLVSYASSIAVDAAVFGKPVINIDFEIRPAPGLRSPTHFYAMAHYQNALRSGGIRLAKTPEELRDRIARYLENPGLDAAGRKRLVREQVGTVDGKAGERLADAVLENCRTGGIGIGLGNKSGMVSVQT